MGVIRDRLASLNVNAASPDELVRASYARASGLHVTLEPEVVDYHDEESLQETVERMVTGVLAGYSRGLETIRREAYGAAYSEGPANHRREQFLEALDAMHVEAKSRRANVGVDWEGKDDVVIGFKRGSLSRLSVQELEDELNEALREAMRERTRQTMQLNREIFMTGRAEKGR